MQLSGAIRLYAKEGAEKQEITVLEIRSKAIPPEAQAAGIELRRLLHLNEEATEFSIVSAPMPSNDKEIAVMTRSIHGMLHDMAAEVEVPAEDLAEHRAFQELSPGRIIGNHSLINPDPQFKDETA